MVADNCTGAIKRRSSTKPRLDKTKLVTHLYSTASGWTVCVVTFRVQLLDRGISSATSASSLRKIQIRVPFRGHLPADAISHSHTGTHSHTHGEYQLWAINAITCIICIIGGD